MPESDSFVVTDLCGSFRLPVQNVWCGQVTALEANQRLDSVQQSVIGSILRELCNQRSVAISGNCAKNLTNSDKELIVLTVARLCQMQLVRIYFQSGTLSRQIEYVQDLV